MALKSICDARVASGDATYADLLREWDSIAARVRSAYCEASLEPKVSSRKEQLERVSAPLAPVPASPNALSSSENAKVKKEVMRKHMTRAYDELLGDDGKKCVYLGEDVRHGGYYLVTDGLFRKHPMRVHDFPPCETSLMGAAMGFSQAGLTPIVEIPYASTSIAVQTYSLRLR